MPFQQENPTRLDPPAHTPVWDRIDDLERAAMATGRCCLGSVDAFHKAMHEQVEAKVALVAALSERGIA